jgi:photosystem II stability/assembly factor-like uncharacterized protein
MVLVLKDRSSTSSDEREDGPEAAARWRERVMRDEHGVLKSDGRLQALKQFESSSKITNATWTALGPIDRGGRARALVIHPQDENILWLAAGSGGIWKSEDAGRTWYAIADQLGMPAGSLIIDPRDPDTLYFGTGERFHSGGPGAGIFVTHNGGINWERIASTKLWRYIPSIAISPTSSRILLAANADPEFPTRSGVYRSTDEGISWTQVMKGEFLTPSAIMFQPGSSSRVLLAVRDGLFPSGESRVMFSDDAGQTWQRSIGVGTMQFTRYEIGYSQSQPNIAYAISREGVFRSEDGGTSFTQRSVGFSYGLVSWTSMLWISPTNPDLLFAGGVSLARSRDGGMNWQRIDYSDELNRDIGHLDHHAIVAEPNFNGTSNREVYVLNDGGIDRLDNALAQPLGPPHAESLDRGMQTIEYYAIAGRISDGLILGGAQDRGVIQGQLGSSRSTLASFGDGVCALIDPDDGRYLYGCAQFLSIARIQPNGLIGISDDLPDANSNTEVRANFLAPVILDPNKTSRMIAGGAYLWRSENVRTATYDVGKRAKWVSIKNRLLMRFVGDDSHLISAIAIAKGDSNDIWVAHNDGRIFRTRNGLNSLPSWNVIDDNAGHNPLPNRYPTRIIIDSTNRRRAFISFGGFSRDNVWQTENGGANWHKASGQMAVAPVWSIAQHPRQPNTIVAGTEAGVYITKDGGQHWLAVRAPFKAAAQDVTFFQGSNKVLVGTFGRGAWSLDIEGF